MLERSAEENRKGRVGDMVKIIDEMERRNSVYLENVEGRLSRKIDEIVIVRGGEVEAKARR
jgi:hypothetical protein